jgi:hexulose-6-phosphate isomerase
MQGRLVPPEAGRFQSFPRAGWREEFPRAAQAGLDSIEWIYDVFGESQNPLASDSGIAEMHALADLNGVVVASVCADYFMDRPITRADGSELREILARLHWLVGRCSKAGIERIVLPFVDASQMRDAQDRDNVVDVLHNLVPIAQRESVEIHLETDLAPADFASLLGRIEHPAVKVNYDSGNSASLGFLPALEFAAYGPRIGSVHIKDRLLGGGTVALGCGCADLEAVFAGLRELAYRGDYILQVARGEPGGEVTLAASNRLYVLKRHKGITAEPIAST